VLEKKAQGEHLTPFCQL